MSARERGPSGERGEAISVVCATFRGAGVVEQQLRSILTQTEKPAEIILVDDASDDDTVEILHRFAAGSPIPVKILENPINVGPTASFARGLAEASGDLIAFADQDDVWYPRRLEAGHRLLETLPQPALVFSPADIVGPELQSTGRVTIDRKDVATFQRSDRFQSLMRANIATGMTMIFDASLREAVMPIPSIWLHDSWIAPIVAAIGTVDVVPEPLVAYRQHPGNLIGKPRLSFAAALAEVEEQGFSHHLTQVERYRALAERLAQLPNVTAAQLAAAKAQLGHWQRRAALPRRPLARVPGVARELVLGRYHRCAQGYHSAARDLIAPA